jgi:hypothetical protein
VGDAPPSFEKLAEDFAHALDAWSQEVRAALGGRPQKVLVHGLGVNQGNVSRWLDGHRQIWKGGAALPGTGLTHGVVEVLRMEGNAAARLMGLAGQVDHLQRQLTAHGRDWRKRAGDHLQSLTDTPPDPGPGHLRPVAEDAVVRARWWDRVPKAARIASAALAMLAAGGLGAAVGWNGGTSGRPAVAAGGRTMDGNAVAAPGTPETGTLGEDSRCSVPFQGPEAVTWRVCARVEAERVSFALKAVNQGRTAITVKIRLEYAQAREFHPCPKAPRVLSLSIAAGKTVVTDPGRCAVPRTKAPAAYQGVGWLLAADANAGSYELSPTAHVYPDRVVWKPDLVEGATVLTDHGR